LSLKESSVNVDCSHTALASRCGQRQTWAASSTGSSHLGHFELDRCFQSFIIFPVPQIPDVCLTIQCRVVKLADVMTWPHATQSTSALVAWPIRSLESQYYLLSVDLPHWTGSTRSMAMLVSLGYQIHVDSKKISFVQASRRIIVLMALSMAVLPPDGTTCTDVADCQDQVKVLSCNRGVLPLIETSLQSCMPSHPTSMAPWSIL
jgi:hypothetical protein